MKKKLGIVLSIVIILFIIVLFTLMPKGENVLRLEGEEFPILNTNQYKYENILKGEDEDGNKYVVYNYNPEKIDEVTMDTYIKDLCTTYQYAILGEQYLEDEIQLRTLATQEGKILVISVCLNEEEAYIKYSIIPGTLEAELFENSVGEEKYDDEYYEVKEQTEDIDDIDFDEIEYTPTKNNDVYIDNGEYTEIDDYAEGFEYLRQINDEDD